METIQLTKQEKIRLNSAEISKKIKQQINKEFGNCKFSVKLKSYSGGCNITIALKEADFKVIKEFSDIPEIALFTVEHRNNYTREEINQIQKAKYHQLSYFRDDYNPNNWNNGVFLTEEGHNLFKRIEEISDQYNYDDSDIQTDYFNVNFYLHLEIDLKESE